MAHAPDPTLFHKQYRIASARCSAWDYASAGAYFVTINTKGRRHWFGTIRQGTIDLSSMGRIAQECWLEIPAHQPHVSLDAFIVMPDHMHGIVIIEPHTDATCRVCTPNRFGPLRAGSLATVIHGYKSACTKRIHAIGHPSFAWQPRYHDHIIHDENALCQIRRYILDNPRRWTSP